MNNLALPLISVFLGSVGQVLLKVGANKIKVLTFSYATITGDIWRIIRVPEILLGLAFFSFSCLLWIKVLTRLELSTAYPLVSLGYLNVAFISYFFLHESFSPTKFFALALIVAGVSFLR